MKIYIQTDIEGVAGFCFRENRPYRDQENIQHRYRMYQLLTNEVNAAVRGAYDAGADEVIINDNHGSGYNILFEQLDERCKIIHGRNGSGPHWLSLLDTSFDAMVLIGMHAMAATPCAIIPHSRWEVNDGAFYMSEGTMAAAIAGDMGIPAVMMSGDDKICKEFREKMPDIEQVQTKEALSPYMACSLIPKRSCELIYEAVKRGIARRSEIKPYKVQGPVRLNLLDSDDHVPPLHYYGKTITRDTISEAFVDYYLENIENFPGYCHNLKDMDGFMYP